MSHSSYNPDADVFVLETMLMTIGEPYEILNIDFLEKDNEAYARCLGERLNVGKVMRSCRGSYICRFYRHSPHTLNSRRTAPITKVIFLAARAQRARLGAPRRPLSMSVHVLGIIKPH